jgi:hypothetical protein
VLHAVNKGAVGRTLFAILILSCSGRTENRLSNTSLITILLPNLSGLKTLHNDGDRVQSEYECDVKYSMI